MTANSRSRARSTGDTAPSKADRPMVTIYDRNGDPFETGDPKTLNSLLCDGYTLGDGTTQAEAMDKIAPPQDDSPTG